MVDDLLSGRVTSFRREQGFGVITLDDGRDVKFDASACTMIPEEGAAVRLRVGPARWGGGIKALHVEPRGSSTMVVSGSAPIPAGPATIEQQIAVLQGEQIAATLCDHALVRLAKDAFGGQLGDASLLTVLDAFYVREPMRAREDGYLRHVRPFYDHSADVLAEIAALVPGGAVPRQLAFTAPNGVGATLRAAMPDGSERTIAVESLDDVVRLVNDSLRAAGDPRRLFALDTGRDWHAYLVLAPDRARRLAGVLPFAAPPQLVH